MQFLIYIAYAVYVTAALLMVGAILLQEGKGGGLSALGGTQAESAFGASNPIRRMTVVLAIGFFFIAGFLSWYGTRERRRPGLGEEKKAVSAAPAGTEKKADDKPRKGEAPDAPAAGEDAGEKGTTEKSGPDADKPPAKPPETEEKK